MKHLIVAGMIAALAVVATDARANDVSMNITGLGGTTFFGALHTDNLDFTDTFTFTIDGDWLVSSSLVTIGLTPQQNIDFSSATLNGIGLSLSPTGFFETAFTPDPLSLTSPFVLTVTGASGAGDGIFASYSGTMNMGPAGTSVSEPASLMLLGAGLAGIGIWRRKSTKI